MTHQPEVQEPAETAPPSVATTMDDLARMGPDALLRRYRQAELPQALWPLDGPADGRLLALTGPGRWGPVQALVRRIAASPWFPWRGKRFLAFDEAHGQGVNRIALGRTWQVLHFETRIEPSAVDGAPCIVLDYDRPDNPGWIRMMRDELRPVGERLYAGPGIVELPRLAPRIILFFAVRVAGESPR